MNKEKRTRVVAELTCDVRTMLLRLQSSYFMEDGERLTIPQTVERNIINEHHRKFGNYFKKISLPVGTTSDLKNRILELFEPSETNEMRPSEIAKILGIGASSNSLVKAMILAGFERVNKRINRSRAVVYMVKLKN